MLETMRVSLLSVLFLQISQSMQINSIHEMLNDFADSKGLTISLHTCWNKKERYQFIRRANDGSGRTKFISIPKNITAGELVHNNLIVINLDNNCESAWSTLLQINRTNLFVSPPKYFLVVNNLEDIKSILENTTAYPASEIFIAERSGTNYTIHQAYRINAVSNLIWENYGSWSSKYGLIEYLRKYPASQRRRNFRQQNLNVIIRILDNDTWNHLDDLRDPGIDSIAKLSYGATKCLLEYCNVNVSYTSTDSFGYYDNSTGKFSGVVGALESKEVDVTGSSIFVTHIRVDVIEFLGKQSPYSMKFLLKKPPLSYIRNIFTLALERNVWISIVVVLAVTAAAFFLVLNAEAKEQKVGHLDKFSTSDVILICLETVCQQGTTTEPKRMSGRILALITFLAFMFVYVAYSANIVAMLQSQIELKSIKELLQSQIAVGAEDNDYMRVYFWEDKDKIRQQMFRNKMGKNGFYSLNEGMEKLRKGFFAYEVELSSAYNYIMEKFTIDEMCCIQEIDGHFNHLRAYTATQKNSPYKEILKTGTLKMDEYGLNRRNFIRYFTKPSCSEKGTNFESIGLIETQMPFIVLITGTLFAVLFLIVEKMIAYMKRNEV